MRPRLDLVFAAALVVEFGLELTLSVPAGTPYRGLVAVLLVVVAFAVTVGRRAPLASLLVVTGVVALLPALDDTYYDRMALPFVMPFDRRLLARRARHAGAARGRPRRRRRRSASSRRCPTTTSRR